MTAHTLGPLRSMLHVAAAQLDIAIHTSEAQVESLATAVARMSTLASGMARPADEASAELAKQASAALVAMQFHDQLMQRVEHVRDALAETLNAMDPGSDQAPDIERVLLELRGRYSMEDERQIFDAIVTTDGPRPITVPGGNADQDRGSVELF